MQDRESPGGSPGHGVYEPLVRIRTPELTEEGYFTENNNAGTLFYFILPYFICWD